MLKKVYVTVRFELYGMVGHEVIEIWPWFGEHYSHVAFRAGVFFGAMLPKRVAAKVDMIQITNIAPEDRK